MSIAKSLRLAAGIVVVVGLVVSMALGYSGSATLRSMGNAVFAGMLVFTLVLSLASVTAAVASRRR